MQGKYLYVSHFSFCVWLFLQLSIAFLIFHRIQLIYYLLYLHLPLPYLSPASATSAMNRSRPGVPKPRDPDPILDLGPRTLPTGVASRQGPRPSSTTAKPLKFSWGSDVGSTEKGKVESAIQEELRIRGIQGNITARILKYVEKI
jgi:hypothetical protein